MAGIACGEKKHPGGKLVKICMRIDNGSVKGVLLTGDFFADPEEAEKLIDELLDLEASVENVVEEILRRLDESGIKLYGVERNDIEEAAKRALTSIGIQTSN